MSRRSSDLTGREQMTWNVLASWGGHLVYIVAGFIMPRLIDRHVGQASLGVWDFSWSLVNYFGLAGMGIGSSVNRYVAMHRAAGEADEMRRAVSSVTCVQAGVAVAILLLTAGAALAIPHWYRERLGANVTEAVWVVSLLGSGLAVQMAFDSFRGVITGCHRWDLHNGINSTFYGIIVTGMIVALSLGGGLRSLGFVNLGGTCLAELYRMRRAFQVCPELEVRISHARWGNMKKMVRFGGKTVVAGLSNLVLIQTSSILVATHLGPTALAVFSRPSGLIRNVQTFLNKFALVLTPMAGSLQGTGRVEEVRKLALSTTRIAVALSLPILLVLGVHGDLVLRAWMGPRYEQGALMAVLACGYFLPMSQQPVMTILAGLDRHGRMGLAGVAAAVAGICGGAILVTHFGWTLFRAALLVAVPVAVSNGVVTFLYACRHLDLPPARYLREGFLPPVLYNLPLAASLAFSRTVAADHPAASFLLGVLPGGVIVLVLYWWYMLEEAHRLKAAEALRGALRRVPVPWREEE